MTAAIYQRLIGDPALLAMLGGDYEGWPKVFTSRPVPEDVAEPLVLISGPVEGPVGSVSLGDSRRVRTQTRRVSLYWPNAGSADDVDRAADTVSALLHRAPLDLSPSERRRVTAGEPVEIPADRRDSVARGVEITVTFVEPEIRD